MLFRVASELALDLPQDWRKIDRRLRDHRDKIRNVLTMDYFMSEIRPDDSDYHTYEADLANVPLLNEAKNDSLYVGVADVGFISPSTRIDQQSAGTLVRLARARLLVFDIPLPKTRDELAKVVNSPSARLACALSTEGYEGLLETAREIAEEGGKRTDR